MKLSSYLLISFFSCIVVLEARAGRAPIIDEDGFPQEGFKIDSLFPRSDVILEEHDIQCTNNNRGINAIKPSSRDLSTESVSDDSSFKFEMETNEVEPKIKSNVKKERTNKRFKKWKGKGLLKKARKSLKKSSRKGSKKSANSSTTKKPFGLPRNNSKMSEPSTEEVFLALPGKVGESINLSKPDRAQFEAELKGSGSDNIFNNGLNNFEQSIDDNFGVQVPTILFKGDSKIPFLDGLTNKLAGGDQDSRALERADALNQPREESKKNSVDNANRTNLQLIIQLVQLLTELNINAKDPSSLSKLLLNVKNELSNYQLEQKIVKE